MYVLEPMTQEDVEEVSVVERRCFTNPWPVAAYRRELRNPSQNYYIVLREYDDDEIDADGPYEISDGTRSRMKTSRFALWTRGRQSRRQDPPPIIGFAGMWHVLDEAHVTTIGVRPDFQGKGLGELLFMALMEESRRREATWVTLEVRVSNYGAQALYRKYEFSIQGKRPRYYSDNHEDAYIMWSESLRNPDYLKRLDTLRRRLDHRLKFARSNADSPHAG